MNNQNSTSIRQFALFLCCMFFSIGAYATCTIAAAPTSVGASIASATSVTVYFVRPAITGSGTVTYTVTSSPVSTTQTTTSTSGGGVSNVTFSGLTTGTSYTFTVAAVADGATGTTFTSAASNSITPRNSTTNTINATTNSDWGTATNWSLGTVPVATDIVAIAASKTVTISNITNAVAASLILNASASLTNNGTLTVSPTEFNGNTLLLNGTNTFDNEGTLTVTSENQYTPNTNTISIGGTGNTLTFNGTTTLGVVSGSTLFYVGGNASATIGGAGFTVGSPGTPFASINANIFGFSSQNPAYLTIDSGTTLNLYAGFTGVATCNVFYMIYSSSVTNNGTVNIFAGSGVTGVNVHAIQIWQTSSNAVTTFTNNGTLYIAGFQQPTIFSGVVSSTNYGKFNNTGTATITTTDVASSYAISSTTLPNQILNSGTLNLYGYTNAIRLGTGTSQTFTNTGTINITKGSIISTGTIAGSTAPTINNNSGGVINFNYGVAAGSTPATTNTVILNNNNGATINGSCTFAAGTLVTAAGSTLSPGDYTGGVSGIGTIVLTPSAAGTKFPLYGSVLMQIKGKTTAGTDFDKISCTELDVTNASLTVTADYTSYTPAVNDYLVLDYSGTSKTGPFSSTSMPRGWLYESTTTNEAAKYYPSVPGAPTSVVATAGNAQASIAFAAPASDGG
ncbi:MAG: fibronectin type III domain-containing protein, partial [Paludibacter sp.]